jgi:hypothetical protein
MRPLTGAILFAVLLAGVATADTFKLRHEASGKTLGPFTCRDGAEVVIGKTRFVVTDVRSDSPAAQRAGAGTEAERLMRNTPMPSVELRFAMLQDCVEFVRASVRDRHAGEAFNIVVRGPQADPFSPDAKRINLSLQRVTAYQVMEEICEQAGFEMKVTDDRVVLSPKK